jgi:hypothetical protein
MPSDLGFAIGAGSDVRALVLDVHYDNPLAQTGLTDSSAALIYYTAQKRKYDIGVMVVGDGKVSLGGSDVMADDINSKTVHRFTCASKDLEPYAGKIKVFATQMHMHRAGDFQETRILDWMGQTKSVYRTELYDGNYQSIITFNESITFEKGDKIVHSCVFDRALKAPKKDLLRWGLEGDEEMCMDFMYFYSPVDNSLASKTPYCFYSEHFQKGFNDTRKEMGIVYGSPPAGKDATCNADSH